MSLTLKKLLRLWNIYLLWAMELDLIVEVLEGSHVRSF